MHEVDQLIHQFAWERDNVVSRGEVMSLGATDRFIANRLARGCWQQLHPGVYLLGPAPPRWEQAVRAALGAAGEGALASHRAALKLWNLDGIGNAPVELTAPHSHRPLPRTVIVHRSRRVEPVSVRQGIPVTSVERTLLELGAVAPPVVVEKAYASALRQGFTTSTKAQLYVEEHGGRGRQGTRVFRDVIGLYDDGHRAPGSAGEVSFLRLLRAAGIEAPVRQLTIPLLDGSKATLDFAWPQRRKAIEFVGWMSHSDSRVHDADTWREAAIRDAGWDLRRWAPYSLRNRPEAVARSVLSFLGMSTHLRGA